MDYYHKIKTFSYEIVPNNISIVLLSYLADSTGMPMTTSTGIDTFSVTTEKSSLPISGFDTFFQQLITSFVYTKYTQNTTGNTHAGSNIVEVSSTSGMSAGMNVVSGVIPSGTTILSVRDSTSLKISANATSDATSEPVEVNPLSWNLNFDSLAHLLSVVDFSQL